MRHGTYAMFSNAMDAVRVPPCARREVLPDQIWRYTCGGAAAGRTLLDARALPNFAYGCQSCAGAQRLRRTCAQPAAILGTYISA
ncbi:hypothetical protein CERSUDRAFT_112988 [Gelatoporia subvermispora B]|uniref:Uncharacterized protein n=1 Tax=Ceriporiopsis subvermispora (strain B) TaxID=914234 RepID=M2QQI7_CERS8|nr:hypothetical protein CERSUDRAFT_112988 [Gelatoporia subvermispora B]